MEGGGQLNQEACCSPLLYKGGGSKHVGGGSKYIGGGSKYIGGGSKYIGGGSKYYIGGGSNMLPGLLTKQQAVEFPQVLTSWHNYY